MCVYTWFSQQLSCAQPQRRELKSSDMWERLKVEPLLLCIEPSKLRRSGHLDQDSPWTPSSGGVHLGRDCETDPGHPGEFTSLSILPTSWDPPEELLEVAGETSVWAPLLKLLALHPG